MTTVRSGWMTDAHSSIRPASRFWDYWWMLREARLAMPMLANAPPWRFNHRVQLCCTKIRLADAIVRLFSMAGSVLL